MKNTYCYGLWLLTAMAISSCVSSLYPISENENEYIFREELVGHWAGKDMGTQVIFFKSEPKKYKVTVIDKKTSETDRRKISYYDTSYFSGFLVQLNSRYFFDCTPDTDHPQFKSLGEETRTGLLPIHFIFHIQIISNNQLTLAGIDIDAMKKLIEKNRNMVKHEKLSNDHILLTANATALQKNILTNKAATLVFNEPDTLTRK